jgi:hypothetical protein
MLAKKKNNLAYLYRDKYSPYIKQNKDFKLFNNEQIRQ